MQAEEVKAQTVSLHVYVYRGEAKMTGEPARTMGFLVCDRVRTLQESLLERVAFKAWARINFPRHHGAAAPLEFAPARQVAHAE